jgi:hypothetical protein
MNRITDKDLQAVVDRINRVTGSPMESYTKTYVRVRTKEGFEQKIKLVANIGNYHLDHAYSGVCLHRMDNASGGVTTPLGGGYDTKRELYGKLQSFLAGIDSTRNDKWQHG